MDVTPSVSALPTAAETYVNLVPKISIG